MSAQGFLAAFRKNTTGSSQEAAGGAPTLSAEPCKRTLPDTSPDDSMYIVQEENQIKRRKEKSK